MKKPILTLTGILFTLFAFSQFTIQGKVVDAETREPLPGASVFAQNTTRGTTTDQDGSFRLHFEKGGYELIISFTGYNSKSVSVQAADTGTLAIELQKADNSMSEVVIKSSFEVENGWEQYGQFFMDYFIGTTPFADSCVIENPEVLKFLYYKRNDRLKVLAGEPLVISNFALGYSLRYELDSFVYFFKTNLNSYRGRCLYSEMEGTQEDSTTWVSNRKKAYYGSRLHFLRSYYDSSLKLEGFTVDLLTEPKKFHRLANPYDTSYYYYNDSTYDVELWFPVTASIIYQRKAPEKEYLTQYKLPLHTRMQMSYVNLTDAIVIKPNGYFFLQNSWINEGYWSWKNIADQLPYDYDPDPRPEQADGN